MLTRPIICDIVIVVEIHLNREVIQNTMDTICSSFLFHLFCDSVLCDVYDSSFNQEKI